MSYFNVSNTIVPKEYQKSKFSCFLKLILNKRKPSMTESLTWRLRYLFNAMLVLQIPSVIFLCNYSRNFCVRFTHEMCSRMSMGLFMVFRAFFVRICSSKETIVPLTIVKQFRVFCRCINTYNGKYLSWNKFSAFPWAYKPSLRIQSK